MTTKSEILCVCLLSALLISMLAGCAPTNPVETTATDSTVSFGTTMTISEMSTATSASITTTAKTTLATQDTAPHVTETTVPATEPATEPAKEWRLGLITSGLDSPNPILTWYQDLETVVAELDIVYEVKEGIHTDAECAAAAEAFAEAGFNAVISMETWMEPAFEQSAAKYPNVQFFLCGGQDGRSAGHDNYHCFSARFHDGRYLTGIAAGMKLNDMIISGRIRANAAKVGYLGTTDSPEVISAYTSFYLGVRSVCNSAKMEVLFAGNENDANAELAAAQQLAADGCVLTAMHTSTMSMTGVVEGIPFVGVQGDLSPLMPDRFLTAIRLDWTGLLRQMLTAARAGAAIPAELCGTLSDGTVSLCPINEAVAVAGTAETVAKAAAALADGSLHVFDTSTFTVNGKELTSFHPENKSDMELVSDGYFHESEYRNVPCFSLKIDGIEIG